MAARGVRGAAAEVPSSWGQWDESPLSPSTHSGPELIEQCLYSSLGHLVRWLHSPSLYRKRN